ncbi:hypothetical protein [Nocardiopsis suaedae]|uniref:Uncharacterized protein n=1 Tax=Nocardiopsis suaedae TaxID=3018444 RepID=A0ABT4TJI8_9ACTN|nr:hypothetical protein [Nocardiopsis suaedae]MDA2804840.1 hypothetical protein [Nocardiopsis suaedae]
MNESSDGKGSSRAAKWGCIGVVGAAAIGGAFTVVAAVAPGLLGADPSVSEDAPSGPSESGGEGDPNVTAVSPVTGVWSGKYRCEELLGMELEIAPDPDSGEDAVAATFTFFPVDGNAGNPLGTFAMQGSYRDGNLALDRDYWIVENPSYVMLDLTGEHPDGDQDRLEGEVKASSRCQSFSIEKIADEAQPPEV